MRVLLIDDDEDIRAAVRASLELGAGWQVSEARTGAEGVDLALATAPDVVLMDLTMPEMDGVCAARELGAMAETSAIPIIFVTARTEVAAERLRRGTSIKGIIAKPFDPAGLAQRIEALLRGDGP